MDNDITAADKTKLTNVGGSVIFKCPKCGKSVIARSRHEREIAVRYTCPSCGFSGPN
ncbi:MAG: zinc finger domain-containing protein [archaeon]